MRRAGLLAVLLLGCRQGGVQQQHAQLSAPATLDFGTVFVGYPATFAVEVSNRGAAPVAASATTSAPFAAEPPLLQLAAGSVQNLRVTYAPAVVGAQVGKLDLNAEDGELLTVALSGSGVAPPNCQTADPCGLSVFSVDAGACVQSTVVDGTACAAGCLLAGSCLAGSCRSAMVASCDDGNPCTLDSCGASGGCEHFDVSAQCPDPGDPCLAAVCDPVAGCTTTAVADGTFCGGSDCSTAHICLSGACTAVPVGEGSVCSPASPCQGVGICHSKVCQQPAPSMVQPAWVYSQGTGLADLFGPLADEAGNVFADEAVFDAGTVSYRLVSLDRDGGLRWKWALPAGAIPGFPLAVAPLVDQGSLVYCAFARPCVVLRTSDGQQKWSFDPASAYFAAGIDSGFIASAASAGAAGVVISARSMNPDAGGGGAALLDWSTGAVKWIQPDPLFGVTTIVDEAGNSYFVGWHADAGYDSERLLSSLTPDGVFRWTVSSLDTNRATNVAAAAYGGRVSVVGVGAGLGVIVSAVDGSRLPAVGSWNEVTVMNGTYGWTIARLNQFPYPYQVEKWELASGLLRFAQEVDGYDGPQALVLLEHGAVLDYNGSGAVNAFAADGSRLFNCQLGTPRTQLTAQAAVPLGGGRWVARTDQGLAAFDLGIDPAPHGWAVSGNPTGYACGDLSSPCPTDGTPGGAHRPR